MRNILKRNITLMVAYAILWAPMSFGQSEESGNACSVEINEDATTEFLVINLTYQDKFTNLARFLQIPGSDEEEGYKSEVEIKVFKTDLEKARSSQQVKREIEGDGNSIDYKIEDSRLVYKMRYRSGIPSLLVSRIELDFNEDFSEVTKLYAGQYVGVATPLNKILAGECQF